MRLRGCLVGLIVIVVAGGLFVTFAVPPMLSTVATALAGQLGAIGSGTTVTVSSDPPVRLLLLQVDTVHVTTADAQVRNVHADSLDVSAHDVSILDHRFGSISGRLTGVEVAAADGTTVDLDSVTLAGPANAVVTTIVLDVAQLRSLARVVVANQIGVGIENVSVEPPDQLTFDLPGGSLLGRLSIDSAGSLVFTAFTSGATFDVFRPDPDEHFTFTSVAVVNDGLQLTGTLDLTQFSR